MSHFKFKIFYIFVQMLLQVAYGFIRWLSALILSMILSNISDVLFFLLHFLNRHCCVNFASAIVVFTILS